MQFLQKFKSIGIVGYVASVNIGSAALFYHDKEQAKAKLWRVPESTLIGTALIGGWLGGMWAMEAFRHKTKKTKFLAPYYSATVINCIGVLGLLNKRTRKQILQLVTQTLRQTKNNNNHHHHHHHHHHRMSKNKKQKKKKWKKRNR